MFYIAIGLIPIGFIADTFQTDRLCSDRFHTDTFHTDMFCLGTGLADGRPRTADRHSALDAAEFPCAAILESPLPDRLYRKYFPFEPRGLRRGHIPQSIVGSPSS
jgi:hypothetical protein